MKLGTRPKFINRRVVQSGSPGIHTARLSQRKHPLNEIVTGLQEIVRPLLNVSEIASPIIRSLTAVVGDKDVRITTPAASPFEFCVEY